MIPLPDGIPVDVLGVGRFDTPMGPVYYSDYLKLDSLLSSQTPLSDSHDETLFILVHQAYELWFKQILKELDSILEVFSGGNSIPERVLSTVAARLERIALIQGVLLSQIDVLETMTPMDFLEFRHLLVPASGFQSVQFREIEIKMGLSTSRRFSVDRHYFLGRLNDRDRAHLEALETGPNLIVGIERWLARIPFTSADGYDFWAQYQRSVENLLREEGRIVEKAAHFQSFEGEAQRLKLQETEGTFQQLFDEAEWNKRVERGEKRFTLGATRAALFILLYRDEPILQMPYRVLRGLMDIDEKFTQWRYRHALMAKRMLGSKVGTGGSSGHDYLKRAADHNRAFADLTDLATYLLPRPMLPVLPDSLRKSLEFAYERFSGTV